MATNFTSRTPSINAAIAADVDYGAIRQFVEGRQTGSVTAATSTSGGVTTGRFGAYTIPSVGTGVSGYVLSCLSYATEDTGLGLICGLEYLLGTLTVSGNSFASGVSMPTKTVSGTSITTAASVIIIEVTTSLVSTTPTLTITYTNQAGTGSRTATMVLPTDSSIKSGFMMAPHLQSGDTGVRAITGMSISTGTAGVINAYGVLPTALASATGHALVTDDITAMTKPVYLAEAGESFGFWRIGSNSSSAMMIALTLIPEPT